MRASIYGDNVHTTILPNISCWKKDMTGEAEVHISIKIFKILFKNRLLFRRRVCTCSDWKLANRIWRGRASEGFVRAAQHRVFAETGADFVQGFVQGAVAVRRLAGGGGFVRAVTQAGQA